jgi:hypothetical protein
MEAQEGKKSAHYKPSCPPPSPSPPPPPRSAELPALGDSRVLANSAGACDQTGLTPTGIAPRNCKGAQRGGLQPANWSCQNDEAFSSCYKSSEHDNLRLFASLIAPRAAMDTRERRERQRHRDRRDETEKERGRERQRATYHPLPTTPRERERERERDRPHTLTTCPTLHRAHEREILNTQYSILNTQYSILKNFFSLPILLHIFRLEQS